MCVCVCVCARVVEKELLSSRRPPCSHLIEPSPPQKKTSPFPTVREVERTWATLGSMSSILATRSWARACQASRSSVRRRIKASASTRSSSKVAFIRALAASSLGTDSARTE